MRVYLDHAATSPMPIVVRDAYMRALELVGNPASTHGHGQTASDLLEEARASVAGTLGCDPAMVTFTGGGTESINLALKGMFWAVQRTSVGERRVVLIAEGEHHATLEAAEWLRDAQGATLEFIPINAHGMVTPEALTETIERVGAERIAVCSFLWANNEVGTISSVTELVRVARDAGVPVHVDAVAALGQVEIDFASLGADALSLSAHKIGGPVGVGALLLSRTATIDSLLHGGTQQRARSGTQNVAGAVAFAAALAEAYGPGFADRMRHLAEQRDAFVSEVLATTPGAVLRGSRESRLPGNAHFTFEGCQGDSLVFLLDQRGISASVGSACQAGVAEVSHVLLAMGLPEATARGSLRFTFHHDTTADDVQRVLDALPDAVMRARAAGLS
ncbi:MAG: cysteine desulfurase [Microbacteriaceae bacterium]|nr:cysteine desulfurase [Microbacteriaceae bacterium]